MSRKELPGDERLRRFIVDEKFRAYDDVACTRAGAFIHRFGSLSIAFFGMAIVALLARGFYLKYVLG